MEDLTLNHAESCIKLCQSLTLSGDIERAAQIVDRVRSEYPSDERVGNLLDDINAKKKSRYDIKFKKTSSAGLFAIDSKSVKCNFEDASHFELKGWINCPVGKARYLAIECRDGSILDYELNSKRPDVVRYLLTNQGENTELMCGYCYTLNMLKIKKLGVRAEAGIEWICEVHCVPERKVLRGKDDWLFLDNDSNRSVDLFTGKILLDVAALTEWDRFFHELQCAQKYRNIIFLIAPSKETVLPHLYPYERGETTVIDQLYGLDSFLAINPLFPVEMLRQINKSYYKTDTHWSELGAYAAFQLCMEAFGLDVNLDSQFEFKLKYVAAYSDLGSKLEPAESDLSMRASRVDGSFFSPVFNNFLVTSGDVQVFQNPDAVLQKKIVIFGGSSSMFMLQFFCAAFRDVVRIYSPATAIYSVLRNENPDFVLLQSNERFLSAPSRFVPDLFHSTLGNRLKKLTTSEIIKMKADLSLNEFKDNMYYRFMTTQLDASLI